MATTWASSTFTEPATLTMNDLENAYANITTTPQYITTTTYPGSYTWVSPGELNGVTVHGSWIDEAPEPEPICENLGEFLLRKYNKEKVCSIA